MECHLCSSQFRSIYQYRLHLDQHESESSEWKCFECNMEFLSETSLLYHKKSNQHMLRIKEQRRHRQKTIENKPGNSIYTIFICISEVF